MRSICIYVVNDSKIADNVGCHDVNEPRVAYDVVLRYLRNIANRTFRGSFTYVYTRGLEAVEYLAKQSRI